MGSNIPTKSEQLFKELCNHHGVMYKRLPTLDAQGRKQPDYELDLDGQCVVVEVKEIESNEADKLFAKALKEKGMASQCRNPDHVAERVRNHINKKGRKQLNSYLERHPGTPAILVLFDAAKNQYTDPYAIQIAMHGFEQVCFKTYPMGHSPTVTDRGFAPRNNKEVRPGKNQQMSALATLHECWDFNTHERFLSLCFYHNQFADHPFDPTWWYGEHVVHRILSEKIPGQYQNWVPISPKAASHIASKRDCYGE